MSFINGHPLNHPISNPLQAPIEHKYSPYTDNGGTSLAIAGKDYCVIAADTRQSEGYMINSRYVPKAYQITNKVVIATNGFHADGLALVKRIKQRIEWYKHAHDKEMSIGAIAQMVSIILYSKRFFPYYTFILLGGLDEQGVGAVYSFDPVGSYERESHRAGGSASSLIQPFLDNQVGFKNQQNVTDRNIPVERAVKLAQDAFTSATERDIHTGDFLDLFVVTSAGVQIETVPLKKD
ncbi:Psmb1-prov protein [Basidiobolus meristosporus CBS 931.73]|uniref:Proteasome subunit beta n=1 Tax=Basidiobolus meristosporus CBS 931.73 TaxID=1314790 RepID=A0A1Y1YJK2_9FUNG|nr:Psmb1-prov protein [Basidiobolus meristosporus CBS 931.73]|eukprot:ORX98201.1 Psmb1-prov protein [Basidiobolus meristosporus CBS 931.73]